jgi:NADH pyrophosphatase NudC (nudix superfamily)
MELDPNIAILAIVTMGVGYVMTLAGVQKSALEWRRRHRICPSCGHAIKARVCKCASGTSS